MRIDPVEYRDALEEWRRGNPRRLEQFLRARPAWWRREARSAFDFDVLVWAIALREYGFAVALVEAGVSVRGRSPSTMSLLEFAAVWRRDKKATLLVMEHGFDRTEALLLAIQCWDLELIDLFLQLGASLDCLALDDGFLSRVHGDVLRYLIEKGAPLPPSVLYFLGRGGAFGDGGGPPLGPRLPLQDS